MSVALIIYGTALGKLTKATENVTGDQISLIASSMWKLGSSVAGMGVLSPFIAIGSFVIVAMSAALMPFAKVLGKIQKATKDLKDKNITTVTDAMWKFAGEISLLSFITPAVVYGSRAVRAMAKPLLIFVSALKKISDMGTIPVSKIDDVLSAMTKIKDYFKNKKNRLDSEVHESVMAYAIMMRPLMGIAHMLVKFNEMGNVPVHMVQDVLDAMGMIARHFKNNPIENKEIKQSRKYKRMMRPFSKTVGHLVKLNKMGAVPLNLVYQTLDAMRIIANYYKEELGYDIPPMTPFVGQYFNVTRAGIHADGINKDERIYNIFDTTKLLNRPVGVMLTNASGLAGISYWINNYYGLVGENAINKKDDLCLAIKEKIDNQFALGRQTAMTDAELVDMINTLAPGRFSK
jgi:hypothetical protein